jgi:tetratricopeptide (TPR) repeat protein
MTRVIFSVCFFICLSAWNGYSQSDDIENSLATAQLQINIQDYTKALLTIEDILIRQPGNLRAQEMKIDILLQLNKEKDALRDIEEYMRMYPAQPEYYYLRALLNLQKEKYFRAVEDFDQAALMEMSPDLASKVYLNRGMAHFYNQDFELAEADFDEVIASDQKNAAAYHGKGMVKYALQKYEEAIIEFQRSLKIEDSNPITHYNIAMSYFRLKDEDNACYHFNKSCALGHRNACRLLMMECDININR